MEGVIGYVTPFAGNFAPRSWALCQGQVLPIAQNTALFSILGTSYGGNGTTTFALPDLRGRAVVGVGQGPGLSSYSLGQAGGTESSTMQLTQMPAHAHPLQITISPQASAGADASSPAGSTYGTAGNPLYGASPSVNMQAFPGTLTMGSAGSSTAFAILQPVLALNYLVCLQGVYPSRN